MEKLLSLWGLMWFAKKRGLLEINVYGDAKVGIDWVNDLNDMQSLGIYGWMRRVRSLIKHFHALSFKHIYLCFNEDSSSMLNFWMVC